MKSLYDMGVEASEEGHTDCKFPCECGRYVEVWNLVFMQFNRDSTGTLTPLPKPCVDTGMGLERIAAVLQGVISNYDTDFFTPLIDRAAELTGVDEKKELQVEDRQHNAASLRVIADHARATTFLITDGVLPSNEGRGYVLRKIMRRAIRHGRLLGANKPFLYEMVNTVREMMGKAYPELLDSSASRVPEIVLAEEKRFAHTLEIGLKKLEVELAEAIDNYGLPVSALKDLESGTDLHLSAKETKQLASIVGQGPVYSGEKAFRLYDTYGLPIDFILDSARDLGVKFDEASFDKAMQEQRSRARASWKGNSKEAASPIFMKIAATLQTEKDFYRSTIAKDVRIEKIITPDGAGNFKTGEVHVLKPGQDGHVILDRTVIYPESGGQVSDTGKFFDGSESQVLADVTSAYIPVSGLVVHTVHAKETLRVGDRVTVIADAERRARVIRNHSGTHLVNAALRNILGTHVKQSGSLNAPERLRFDFTHLLLWARKSCATSSSK